MTSATGPTTATISLTDMERAISAISTANGVGGVAIIRMSGEGVFDILEKAFRPLGKIKTKDFEPYKMYVGEIDCGDFTDFGMAVIFKAPKSYTGEDMVEFHCHGGVQITRGVFAETVKLGAAPATRGEFTKRAFINGKLSLDGAEGLISMINGESRAAVKAGYSLYREKLYEKITAMQNDLTFCLAGVNADMDYPEEDLQATATSEVKETLESVKRRIKKLLEEYKTGAKVKSGVKVAIVGKPNTGKSSILNRLLEYDKAIVSSVAGTTRDVVEGAIEINGVNFYLFDTAGIRESDDEIEKIGIEKSAKILKTADIAIAVFDGSEKFDNEDKKILSAVGDKETITVYNKSDLSRRSTENGLIISAKTGEGLEELKNELYKRSFSEGIDENCEFVTEERHYNALKNAYDKTVSAIENADCVPLDLISEDIKDIWSELGLITGKTANEEIIDEIFSKFCVGK